MASAPAWSNIHDRIRADNDTLTKSLTPQRKHRKLLKDGSGIEVWPESVEKIFVQGLRKYWESPYATSQSRGRSRWRNQFLVDYLKSNAIDRTKKQVASHIQVLRNMWKGEPEFYLVAGGEELYSEQNDIKVKSEEPGDQLFSRYPDFDDADSSSNGTSPNFSPPEIKTEFPPSPGMPLRSSFPPDGHSTFYNQLTDGIAVSSNTSSMIPSRTMKSYPTNMGGASQFTACVTNYDYYNPPPDFASADRFSQGVTHSPTAFHNSQNQPPKLKALKFIVDGANPSWVRLDTLTSLGQLAPLTPLTLKIKLAMSHLVSSTTPSIAVSLYFSSPTYSAKCSTQVFVNGQIESAEDVSLTLAASPDGYLTAALPGSRLNQCRWLEPSLPIVITQEITADDQTLLFVIYVLDRTANSASAQLLHFWKFHHNDKTAAAQLSLPSSHSDQQALSALNAHSSSLQSAHGNSMPYTYMSSPQSNRYSLSASMTC